MSATELLEKVKELRPAERRKFLEGVHRLEEASMVGSSRKKSLRWPDAAARRRKIFRDQVLPNLVLLGREEEPY